MPKPPIAEVQPPSQTETQSAPRWETWTLALSFVVLWAWFLARIVAGRAGQTPAQWWQIPLFVSLGLLIWIFVRRMKRALTGLKEIHPARRGPTGRN